MTPLSTPPATASGRPRTARRSTVLVTALVTIIGGPFMASAVADDDGTSVPTGATMVADQTPVEPARKPRVVVRDVVEAAPEPDTTAVAVAAPAVDEPALDILSILTDPYTWDERSLQVAALQQVLNVEVNGRYDAHTRLFHLDFLEIAALSTDGVPDEAPPGPSAEEWAALRDCESGGDYAIASSSGRYRGAYQFVQSTWDSVAERNDPTLVDVDPAAAAPADQDAMARALYREAGAGPWPVCGRHLS